MAAISERLTERAFRPSRRAGVHSRWKWTPSTRLSVVTRARPEPPPPPRRPPAPPRHRPPGECGRAGGAGSPARRSRDRGRIGVSAGSKSRGPPRCRVEGDLNLVTRWEPYAPLQASSTRRHAHRGAMTGPLIKDVGSGLPDPSRTPQRASPGMIAGSSAARQGGVATVSRGRKAATPQGGAQLARELLRPRRACPSPPRSTCSRRRKHSSARFRAASTAMRTESTAPSPRLTSRIWAST